MRSGSWRPWLTWTPPVLVTVVLVIALQLSGGGAESARSTTPDSRSSVSSSSSPSSPPTAGRSSPTTGSTPTTAFFDRVPVVPAEPFDYDPDLPDHFRTLDAVDSSPTDNPVTDAGATLGRVLFYDVNLSRNRTVRCASCHVQTHSFADPLVLSQGVDGIRTRRNSMSLANAGFNVSGRYLWDEAAATLETQVLLPFEDRLEMDLPVPGVVQRINERPYYEPLFVDAFGDGAVTAERVAAALAQFVRSMVSADSRYDRGRAQVRSPADPFPNFTELENRGKQLFVTPRVAGGGGCAGCHTGEAQVNSADGLKNNGIDPPTAVQRAADLGGFEVTGDISQLGSFRVPSLRNVEVTGPYMHDGRLVTLEDVIDHYSERVQAHENLSRELRGGAGQPIDLPFDEEQKAALLAFLKTLTDENFLNAERFSEPFRSS